MVAILISKQGENYSEICFPSQLHFFANLIKLAATFFKNGD